MQTGFKKLEIVSAGDRKFKKTLSNVEVYNVEDTQNITLLIPH